jgi:hypothetical protein
MKFLSALAAVLAELGVGTALFVCLQQAGEIRKSFFTFQAYLTAICFLLVALTFRNEGSATLVYFISALTAVAAGELFSSERYRPGKAFLLLAALIHTAMLLPQISYVKNSPGVFTLNWTLGMLFFGWVNGAMILGHWYLIMRGLSFIHLQKASFQLLVLVVLRVVGVLVAVFWICPEMAQLSLSHDPLLFWSRMVWGLGLPGAFGFMAWRCAKIGSNQAGTGLLYIAEVAVLLGEILAQFIGF